MRFLRNLTADAILILGWGAIAILAVPLILIEILYHTGLLGWAIWAVIIWLVVRKIQENKEAKKS